MSFLTKPLLARPKAELTMRVVLAATSRMLLVFVELLKVIVRPLLSEMLRGLAAVPPTARKVAVVPLRKMPLLVLPRAASLLKARTPPETMTFPVKLLVALFSSITPVPALVQAPLAGVPVTWPLRIRLGRTSEVRAPLEPTEKVVSAWLMAVPPVNSTA